MVAIANVVVSNTGDTFGTWVERTNDAIERINSLGLTANTISVNAHTSNTVDANTVNVGTLTVEDTTTLSGNVTVTGLVVNVDGKDFLVTSNTVANGTFIVNGVLTVNSLATFTSGIENEGSLWQIGTATLDGGLDSNTTIEVQANTDFLGANVDVFSRSLFLGESTFANTVTVPDLNTEDKTLVGAIQETDDNALSYAIALG